MGRAVVGDEEHATSATIRFLAHYLGDQALERGDAGLAFAAAEQLGAMHIPSSEIGQRTGARIFVLDVNRTPRGGRQREMLAPSGLDAGLLVSAEHVVAWSQGFARKRGGADTLRNAGNMRSPVVLGRGRQDAGRGVGV